MEIIVYTTKPCAYCTQAKALLSKRGLAFEEIDLSGDPEARAALSQRTGMMTLPQVIIDGELVGGFDEVRAADRAGRLAA